MKSVWAIGLMLAVGCQAAPPSSPAAPVASVPSAAGSSSAAPTNSSTTVISGSSSSSTPTTTPPAPLEVVPPAPSVRRPPICGNAAVLSLDASTLVGVRIHPGDDVANVVNTSPAGSSFVFAPGTYLVGSPLNVQSGDNYLGAPGAILDGGYLNSQLFAGRADDVVVSGLTIRRFGTESGFGSVNSAAVNRSTGDRWTVTRSTFELNDGAALNLGSGSLTQANCFDRNGQYGVSVPGRSEQISQVRLIGNEFRNNNRSGLDGHGCSGCTGAMKFWKVNGATISNNWIHHNNGVGVWIDNNNTAVVIDQNWVNDNTKEAIMYETSYNGRITNNTLENNTVIAGSARTDMFPKAAIFVSSSGGNPDTAGTAEVLVAHNTLNGNWNGITVFSDGDRFCGSITDTSVGHCTIHPGASNQACVDLASTGDGANFLRTCYWSVRAVRVVDNSISISASMTSGCGGRCGRGVSVEATKTSANAVFRSPSVSVPNPLAGSAIRQATVAETTQSNNVTQVL